MIPETRTAVDTLDVIEIKNLCSPKNIINRVKNNLQSSRILTDHVVGKSFMSRIFGAPETGPRRPVTQLKNGQRI